MTSSLFPTIFMKGWSSINLYCCLKSAVTQGEDKKEINLNNFFSKKNIFQNKQSLESLEVLGPVSVLIEFSAKPEVSSCYTPYSSPLDVAVVS
jgi:hypothetical protein